MIHDYKLEKFKNSNLPVYSSMQTGKGEIVVPHFHEGAELIKILSGSAEISINTQKFTVYCGDIIFIPPFCLHSLNGKNQSTKIIGIVYNLSIIMKNTSSIPIDQILSKDKITSFIINKEHGIYKSIDNAIDKFRKSYIENNPFYNLNLLSSLFEITALLCENYYNNFEMYEKYDRIQPVLNFIQQNYTENLSLKQLSDIINVCDDHLIRLFKKSINKSPIKYINDLRLQEVMKLLINTELSVTQIAYKVGFSDPNYMTRIFKSTIGCTPGQYRKKSKPLT